MTEPRPCLHHPCPICQAPPFKRSKVPDLELSARVGRRVLKDCPGCKPLKWGSECGCEAVGLGVSTPK